MELVENLFGAFLGDHCLWWFLGSILAVLACGYFAVPLLLWTIVIGILLVGWNASTSVLLVFAVLAVIFNTPLRKVFVSSLVLSLFKKMGLIPKISDTERTALDAGVVWIESELFSGKPNFKRILNEPYPKPSADEQAFIDEKVDNLCSMVDDWKYWEERQLTPEAEERLRKDKFFGMIVPKEWGGLGFSAIANSEVVAKSSTRSGALGVFIMVPNSLGPAELLMHYGTEAQKKKYLARLAIGDEIPCFALTEPTAGSDAGSIKSNGIVFKGEDGKLYVKLNWNKRWITLAAISTLLGVAFRMRDPENLLGKGEDVGITCALIPTDTKGVVIGRRHDPLGVPFWNCPTQGHDVIVPIEEAVVGGLDGCGKGWGMLMDCLTAGRGISLPSQAAGAGKYVSRAVSAHATNRKQFGLPVGKFEGVEEPMARIVGYTYIMEACRKFTAGSIDSGVKSPVITAIAKQYNTEMLRKVVNDGMDIMGGSGISRGPRNTLAHAYMTLPIGITVEGANIMTRTLIIFGQGSLRAHPYAYKEVSAVESNDLSGFDKAFWGHIGFIFTNLTRSLVLSLTRGRLVMSAPGGPLKRYYQKLAWTSATFAFMSDIAMGSLGGALKAKGKITGRYADILSWMYLATCVLRRWEAEGRMKEDLPVVEFAVTHALHEIQNAFDGIFQNLPVPGLSWLFRGPIRLWSRFNAISGQVSDKTSHKVAQLIQQDSEQRDRLTEGVYMSTNPDDALARLDNAFKMVKKAEAIEKKIKKASKQKVLPRGRVSALIDLALEKAVITPEEHQTIKKSEEMRLDAIQVDDFSQEEYLHHRG
ncbi:MAG: acyl-CoA dehydrogenase [Bdellovibrionales bacterium]|nr:acyl-CoA dehydrogenase [Bdellovibrionales bacterium]